LGWQMPEAPWERVRIQVYLDTNARVPESIHGCVWVNASSAATRPQGRRCLRGLGGLVPGPAPSDMRAVCAVYCRRQVLQPYSLCCQQGTSYAMLKPSWQLLWCQVVGWQCVLAVACVVCVCSCQGAAALPVAALKVYSYSCHGATDLAPGVGGFHFQTRRSMLVGGVGACTHRDRRHTRHNNGPR